ncbi:MAG: PIN domain-containing protein [Chloroflexota bacterium]|nr:PIN domain-containing protein [Chloroflexota bacterium]MDE2898678.1 PIN domain-containing protein [Chloroflexota bacterium]
MSGFLLDTNVVSEAARLAPDARVMAFLADQRDLWLSPVVLHELEFGVQRLPEGRRRGRLRVSLAAFIREFEDRIMPLGRREAEAAASLRAQAQRAGRALSLGDALIAGTAQANQLCLATRNVADFEVLDVQVSNPWDWSEP